MPAVIIDNGTGFIKAGFEGEDSPKVVLPTLIGKPKMPGIMVGMDQKEFYVGEEVIEKQEFLNIATPI
jgi:actin beta/gamma 1/actin